MVDDLIDRLYANSCSCSVQDIMNVLDRIIQI